MPSHWSEADERFMAEAVRLSKRGFPAPNPHVGCVIVSGEKVVGKGYHAYAGGPHAEVAALTRCAALGVTCYVTLEPCAHHGRTPPCADSLAQAAVARVVVAARDPNPAVNGLGIRRLRSAGVRVEVGLMEREAIAVARHHHHFFRTGRPWVTIKAAMSLDGKIATHTGDSKWITDEAARAYAHRLRADHAAVLVGVGTVIKDDPCLTARVPGVRNQPLRVVLDPDRAAPAESRVFSGEARTLRLSQKNPAKALAALAREGITSVLVEGGGDTIGKFVDAGLVDAVCLFYAPILIGGKDAKTALEGTGARRILDALRVENATCRRIGGCWVIEGTCLRESSNT